MKTALQQLIEEQEQILDYIEALHGRDSVSFRAKQGSLDAMRKFLPAERQQIKNALFDGYWMSTINALSQEDIEKGFPEYYEKTYGNESSSDTD